MLISTKSTYALRAMSYLALNEDPDEYICICDLSNALNISRKYLESIMTLLSKNKVVDVYRGKCGGYRLNKAVQDYKLYDIISVTEKDLAPLPCLKGKERTCDNCHECATYKIFQDLQVIINDFFNNKTLKDLIEEKCGQ